MDAYVLEMHGIFGGGGIWAGRSFSNLKALTFPIFKAPLTTR